MEQPDNADLMRRILRTIEHEYVIVAPGDLDPELADTDLFMAVSEAVNVATDPYHKQGWFRLGATTQVNGHWVQMMVRADPDQPKGLVT